MRFNLKNFPKYKGWTGQFFDEAIQWREGFEAELREKLQRHYGESSTDQWRIKDSDCTRSVHAIIKEILGE